MVRSGGSDSMTPKPPAGSGLQMQSSLGGGGGQTHFKGGSPKRKGKKAAKPATKNKEHDFKVKDRVKLLGEWGYIIEVRADDVRIKSDGLSGNTNIIHKDMLHKVPYRPDPIAKMSFYWQVKPRTPTPSVPAILAPAPAASDMASVPVRLGGGGIPPIPGVEPTAAPKPVKRRQPAAKPAKKPKKTAAPKPKNGKKTAPELTAKQRKHLAETGSVTVKRGGKFIQITR